MTKLVLFHDCLSGFDGLRESCKAFRPAGFRVIWSYSKFGPHLARNYANHTLCVASSIQRLRTSSSPLTLSTAPPNLVISLCTPRPYTSSNLLEDSSDCRGVVEETSLLPGRSAYPARRANYDHLPLQEFNFRLLRHSQHQHLPLSLIHLLLDQVLVYIQSSIFQRHYFLASFKHLIFLHPLSSILPDKLWTKSPPLT